MRTRLIVFAMALATAVIPAQLGAAQASASSPALVAQVPSDLTSAVTAAGGGSVLPPPGTCEKTLENKTKREQLAASGKRMATCVEQTKKPGTTGKDVISSMTAAHEAGIGVDAIKPVPAFCNNLPADGLWYSLINDRLNACNIATGGVNVIDLDTFEVIGTFFFGMINYSYTANNSRSWKQQFQLGVTATAGFVPDIDAANDGTACTGTCVFDGMNFPNQSIFDPNLVEADADFHSSLVFGQETGVFGIYFYFTAPDIFPSQDLLISPPPVRCDNTLGGIGTGCVFYTFRPVMIYQLSGPYPALASHIQRAQNSGLPGAYPNGAPLTRTTDAGIQNANNAIACPASIPRLGLQCDEYPFQSTYQGAAIQADLGFNGRTFPGCNITLFPTGVTGPGGWSSCLIPGDQNTNGGNQLGVFYQYNRVLDGDPFYVLIAP